MNPDNRLPIATSDNQFPNVYLSKQINTFHLFITHLHDM